MKIGVKILLSTGLVIVVAFVTTAVVIGHRSAETAKELTYQVVIEAAHHNKEEIQSKLEHSLGIVQALSFSFIEMARSGQSYRPLINNILSEVLKEHPQTMLGIWTLWEPDAFDGRDREFVNSPEHDDTGRVNSYWHWDDKGDITLENNVEWEGAEWYDRPRLENKPTLLEPYIYKVSGVDTLLVSLSTPIVIEGQFRGVVGMDFKLSALQTAVEHVGLLEAGYSVLMMNDGTYITHVDKSRVGKSAAENGSQSEVLKMVQAGDTFIRIEQDEYLQQEAHHIYTPITLEEGSSPWWLMVAIPSSEVRASSTDLKQFILLSGLFSLAFIIVIIFLLVRYFITRPVADLEQAVQRFGENDNYHKVPVNSADEIGSLSHSFNRMAEQIARNSRQREAAELEVKKVNEELEQRVLARTTELNQAKDEAEAASRVKTTFLATMSHEIRTPLNGIVASIDMLSHTELEHQQQDLIHIAGDSAASLQLMIDNLLDFSKIEGGYLQLENQPLSLEKVAESLTEDLQQEAVDKACELLVFCDPELPGVVGDVQRIKQILLHLTSNAVKFSCDTEGRAGQVMVSIRQQAQTGDGVDLCVQVQDNGIGMSAEDQQQVFVPFSQVEENITRRFDGAGLGLAITRRLVELMGGRIELQSEVGQGSTFSVLLCLPRADVEATSESTDLSDIPVLLVKSTDNVHDLLHSYLQHAKALVTVATAQQATAKCQQLCRQQPLVVVVVDDQGHEHSMDLLCETMRQSRQDAELRFVLLGRGLRRYARYHGEDGMVVDLNVMRRHSLINAVAVVAERESPLHTQNEQLLPVDCEPLSSEEARTRGRLILLAEDNDINQMVISQQLAMLGCGVELAVDGQQALSMWQAGDYNLVMTDCHMPNMDGYQLSRAIRETEAADTRVPIIAVTADALKGTNQKCLDAGMDDYLSKPMQVSELRMVLDKWLSETCAQPVGDYRPEKDEQLAPPAVEPATDVIVDPQALGKLLGSQDQTLLLVYYSSFLETSLVTVAEFEAAYQAEDMKEIGRLAHKMKSSARTVGANHLADCCYDLEQAAKTGDTQRVEMTFPNFKQRFQQVSVWVEHYQTQQQVTANTESSNLLYSDSLVLVVDDEPFVLKTTAVVLANLGFETVLTAATGEQALQIITSSEPPVDLLLSDLNMPDVDGIELLRRCEEMGYAGDLLLFSGEDNQTLKMAERLAREHHLSVLGSLAKPIQVEELSALLTKHVKKPGLPGKKSQRASLKPRPSPVTAEMLELAIDAGELEPWFQPKIDIASRQPVGLEMLARWPNSVQGPIYPDMFIPVAEANGLIDKLTFALVKKAVQLDQQWRQQGLQLKIAVNISMDSLLSIDFPERLDALVKGAGGNLSSLQLEVTESRLMEDLATPLEVLLRLRMKKTTFSIDDFGTGHSNLGQLRDLPFDELKLDRSYVHGASEARRSKAILQSTVEMAKRLGMSIVAEGVETLEEWKMVEQLGCDQVQGYFTARPMPGDDILCWMAAWQDTKKGLFG